MRTTANPAAKKALQAANSAVNFAALAFVLLLAGYGCYALWDSSLIYQAADAVQYEIYKPVAEDEGQSFEELQALNPEVFSWLTVYGTHIDYPVAQGEDNMKYVNTNALGEYSLSGSIFLDYSNQKDFSDFNSILYGHHMEQQTMFGELGLFADEDYFSARFYGNLYYGGRDYGLEFFAFLHVDAYDASVFRAAIEGDLARQAYLDNILEQAVFLRDIGVTISDRIVLLSTCSAEDTNGRDILVARITRAVYDDPFEQEDGDFVSTGFGGFFSDNTPVWLRIALPAFILLTLAAIIILSKRRHKEQ